MSARKLFSRIRYWLLLVIGAGIYLAASFHSQRYPADEALFFYPRWACGDEPPFVAISVSGYENERFVLQQMDVRLNKDTALVLFEGPVHADALVQSTFRCRGWFVESSRLYPHERILGKPAVPREVFFEAEVCELADRTAPDEDEMINRILRPYLYEGDSEFGECHSSR